jgi:DNA-dependent protein kinase catalytic subunit
MDTKTGGILQIDFGICFGMGSSVLPVPEFIPFRLTTQLREILQPLDGTGLLRHYMVQGLQCLREEEFAEGLNRTSTGLLANALEVYVNDPVVDWLKAPIDKEDLIQLRGDVEWEPRRRVKMAMDKLMGVDPAKLILEDLKINPAVKKFHSFAALSRIVMSPFPSMSESSEDLLEAGEQVDRLIALATDPNILVRHWSGLQTWL